MSQHEIRSRRQDMSQLLYMMKELHEMNKFLGNQKVGSVTIKLDQFERYRQNFSHFAEKFENSSLMLKNTSDRLERAKLVYAISESKQEMQTSLKNMTNITLKLAQKHRKKKAQHRQKNQQQIADPIEEEIQYKNLTLYNLQKCFFRLTKTQRDIPSYKSIKGKQITTLSQLKRNAQAKKGLMEDQQEQENLEEKQMLEALKHIDNEIEQKLDIILDGVNTMHYHAMQIHESLNLIQKKIVINRDKINKNMVQLRKNQKRIDQVNINSKSNCIANVVILVLIGLLVYLTVQLVFFDDYSPSDIFT